uniref:TRAF-type zinc finger domain-containing protein 1 n=1 Tax=Sphenodon punctatus TaxID=8508 RepID=A0A8D0GS70_SPHPU
SPLLSTDQALDKKEIPVANFTIHEIHCSRNIGVCRLCKESIPKSEMKTHIELEHAQVTCKCNMKMEKVHLEEHEASACPLRLVVCQHCEIELAFNKLQDHEDYCGARTERCSACGRNVMVKDLKDHPEVCGKEGEETRVRRERPRYALEDRDADLCTNQIIQNHLGSDGYVETLPRMTRLPESRFYSHFGRDQVLRDENRRNASSVQRAQNPGKMGNTPPLALVPHNPSLRLADDIMLPCEFCEVLFPEDDLILHQTGCNPASALASFSKRSSSPSRHSHGGHLRDFLGQLHGTESSRYQSTYLSQQQGVEMDGGSIIIPCEFCGIQLEEEVLFHHQDQCDLRPATANSERSSSQQTLLSSRPQEGMESPDLPRRHIRHQGIGTVQPSSPTAIQIAPGGSSFAELYPILRLVHVCAFWKCCPMGEGMLGLNAVSCPLGPYCSLEI